MMKALKTIALSTQMTTKDVRPANRWSASWANTLQNSSEICILKDQHITSKWATVLLQ